MSTSQIVWLVIGVLAALGVAGIAGLVVLWGTAGNPGRSAVRKEIPADSVDRYITRGASFAIVLGARHSIARWVTRKPAAPSIDDLAESSSGNWRPIAICPGVLSSAGEARPVLGSIVMN